jgi:hypothetical protein
MEMPVSVEARMQRTMSPNFHDYCKQQLVVVRLQTDFLSPPGLPFAVVAYA